MACVFSSMVTAEILSHLGLPAHPLPLAPARDPHQLSSPTARADEPATALPERLFPRDRPRASPTSSTLAEALPAQLARVLLAPAYEKAVHLSWKYRQLKPDGTMRRFRMVSAKTVLRARDGVTQREAWSYLRLADELQRWVGDPRADRQELFRRMAFNALISNLDDHPRNHALIAPGKHWQLSPAYDLTPTPVRSADRRDLALEAGRQGRWANRSNLLSECPRFGFTPAEANATIDRIKALIARRWKSLVRSQGGTEADLAAVALAFDYPGFEYS